VLRALLLGLVLAAAAFMPAAAEELPVTTVTIYPGDPIGEGMLTEAKFPDGTSFKLPVVAAREDLVGKVARRTILPGRLIARNSVAEPELVTKGTVVAAVYSDGPLTITTSVLALQSGALGAAVQVRNIDSGKVIVASVQGDGTVKVGGR
jgi:flagella basal body P-ring formation protein FlgA